MSRLLRLALEERSDGQAQRECEFTFYGRLEDLNALQTAQSSEHQEQWELPFPKTNKNGGEGRMRVRKTVPSAGGNAEYVLTVKTKIENTKDEMETPIPTTEAMFNQFKIMSERGMVKDRYFFPVEGSDLVWEVDMFLLPGSGEGSGEYHEWCKIDLEVPSRDTPIPSLPLKFIEIIMAQDGARTVEEETKIRGLYDNEFITPNPHMA